MLLLNLNLSLVSVIHNVELIKDVSTTTVISYILNPILTQILILVIATVIINVVQIKYVSEEAVMLLLLNLSHSLALVIVQVIANASIIKDASITNVILYHHLQILQDMDLALMMPNA